MVKKLRHEQFTEKQISYTAIMQWHELCYCVDTQEINILNNNPYLYLL